MVFSASIPHSYFVPTFHNSINVLKSKSYEKSFDFSAMYNFQDVQLLCALCVLCG